VILSPAKRFSILVSIPANASGTFQLVTNPYLEGFNTWPNGPGKGPLTLATLQVQGTPVAPFVTPTQLTPPTNYSGISARTRFAAQRTVELTRTEVVPGHPEFLINGGTFPNAPLFEPRLNTTEEWDFSQ